MSSSKNTSLIFFEESEDTIVVSMLGSDATIPVSQTYATHLVPKRFQTSESAEYFLMTQARIEEILRQKNTDYQIVKEKTVFDHACAIRKRMKATDAAYFILDNNKDPQPVKSVHDLAGWQEQQPRETIILAYEQVNDVIVSTQFFGTWTCIYETMVFTRGTDGDLRVPQEQFTRRYETYEIAMQGHREVVAQCKQKGERKAHG